MISLADAEVFAHSTLVRGCQDGADRVDLADLLEREGIAFRRIAKDSPMRGLASTAVVAGVDTIFASASLRGRDLAFNIAHELGHIVVRRWLLLLECGEEAFCNRFAAGILVPASSLQRAWRTHGADLPALAEARSHVAESVVARRIDETGLARVWIYESRRCVFGGEAPRGTYGLAVNASREGEARNDNAHAWRLREEPTRVVVVSVAA